MKYKDSKKLLKELKKAKRILINVHRSPDQDGIGSALSFYEFLESKGKELKVICPSDLTKEHTFLPHAEVIEKIDFSSFDFDQWDILLCLDSANWGMVSGGLDIKMPEIKMLLIDHHVTSERFAKVNIVDDKVSSTCELVYLLFKKWKIKLSRDICQNLLAGIICDTGVFEYPNTSSQTLGIVKELMDKGANKNEIVEKVYRNYPFNKLKLWGKILEDMQFDKENKFVYSAVSYESYKEYGEPVSAKETSASMFCPIIDGADFGMVMIEEDKEKLTVSFRSKKDFDVSRLAKDLDGGGHRLAAGATITGEEFPKAVNKVIKVAMKYAQKDKTNL